MLKLNETPVRTSKNFNINNINLENVFVPEDVEAFDNVEISGDISKVLLDSKLDNFKLTYGLGEYFTNQVKEKANKNIKIILDKNVQDDIKIDFKLDENNKDLIDNIEIVAEQKSKATIIIKYNAEKTVNAFHNGIIRVNAHENSDLKVIVVNFLNDKSTNFLSIENQIAESAKVKFTIVDFGGKNSITNYYSNLVGDFADNKLNTIYLGKDNQVLDLNYIAELRGKKSNIDMEVQGALKDTAKKHFKGTIDFKKGCKKATGNENEACMLLSKTAKSIALPMLLCSEEDVEGNHSSSAGKIGEKELFYIMSRGFDLKEAMKLMVRAKFNKIIESIKNEELKNEIIYQFEKKLD